MPDAAQTEAAAVAQRDAVQSVSSYDSGEGRILRQALLAESRGFKGHARDGSIGSDSHVYEALRGALAQLNRQRSELRERMKDEGEVRARGGHARCGALAVAHPQPLPSRTCLRSSGRCGRRAWCCSSGPSTATRPSCASCTTCWSTRSRCGALRCVQSALPHNAPSLLR